MSRDSDEVPPEPSRVLAIEDVEANLREAPRLWLVTGAAGFLGSHLVQELLDLGQGVLGVDDFSTGSPDNLCEVRALVGEARWARFEFTEGSLLDPELCRHVCRDAPLILHQAALGSVPRSIADPLASLAANVQGLAQLAQAAHERGARRFVFASSSSVYGDHPGLPRREDRRGAPLSPYAATKGMAELWMQAARSAHGLESVGLRYFNLFGPRQDPNGPYAAVIPRWILALMDGQAPELHGDGGTSRDFCPVTNAVQANLLAALAPPSALGRSYNVGLGGQVTLGELFKRLRAGLVALGFPCAHLEPRPAPRRPGDVDHSRADLSLARRCLGYRPRLAFGPGLERTLRAYAARRS